ncbi:MAG: glycoside hydrolase family 3 C-terminal domain-containing protein [Oscillospiraceae bacterium]|nr:glycoside hydrolase family 3 C-terminal domain-containing protein [Oscillospiraceae bacterium]
MKSRKLGLKRGLAALLASIFVLLLFGTAIAEANAGKINSFLGTSSYKIEKTGESAGDGIYFESEFKTLKEVIDAKEALAREISDEGTVLFKNNGALPLSKTGDKVTFWGLNVIAPTFGGLIGSTTSVNYEAGQQTITLVDAMKELGFSVNEEMLALYNSDAAKPFYRKAAFFGQEVPGHSLIPVFWPMFETADSYIIGELPSNLYTDAALNAAKDTTAIVFLSRDSSEASDYAVSTMKDPNGDNFERPMGLSDYEKAMIDLAKANSNGKVIVVINADVTMELEDLKQDEGISAIVWAGLPGAYGFRGVADVLAGDVNPSGHISDTYAVDSTSAPAMQNFGLFFYTNEDIDPGNDKGNWYIVESEGIYVGYKYYETRYEDAVLGQGNATTGAGATGGRAYWNYAEEVTYPFGYGLSYTTFDQEFQSVDFNIGGESKAVVKVTNTGSVAGKDVVQLYVQSPYTAGGLEKSAIQLVGFAKTGILQPGASETVTVEFDAKYVASYDENAVKADGTVGAWVLDAGDYYFAIGNGAHEAINNVIALKQGNADFLEKTADTDVIDMNRAKKVSVANKDIETYSVGVQNELQDGDLNKLLPGTAEYFTRADWSKGWHGTWGVTANDAMLKNLHNQVYELTENGEGVTWGASNGLRLIDLVQFDENGNYQGAVALDDPLWDMLLENVTLEEAVNFMERAGDNFDPINSIGLHAVTAYDGPVGFVSDQVPGYTVNWSESEKNEPTYVGPNDEYAMWQMPTFPTEPVVAATFNVELVEREGELMGEDSLWSNACSIFGPGLNNHRATYNSRNHEYYSEDSMLTNILGVAVCKGGKSKGLMMEPKHFALNHQEANRSGTSTFITEQGARENELRGFQGCLEGNYAQGVMTAFNRLGTVYAGAHRGLLTEILRNEWGYTGYVITDMINGPEYMNWRDVTLAGGGGCLTSTAYESSIIGSATSAENLKKIQKDTAFQQELKQMLKYDLYTFANSNTMNGITSDTRIVRTFPWWEITVIAADVVFGVATVALCALYVVDLCKKQKEN